jgi:hypothetical protein
METRDCNCETCQELSEFYANLQKIPEELRSYFEAIYISLAGQRLDNEVNNAILNGEWPGSEEIWRANGWIRKPEPVVKESSGDPCPNCGLFNVYAASGGGEKCTTAGCGYWFCY